MSVGSWELVGWNEDPHGDGNISISLSEIQKRVIFEALGIKIIDDGDDDGFYIKHYTDDFLKTKIKKSRP